MSEKKSMKKTKKKSSPEKDVFDEIALNALEFLSSAIANVRKDPRRSVIDFYAAYELILKARLAKEHWSLIFADPGNADRNKLKSGDFLSVSAKDAVPRLAKVVGRCPLDADANCFEAIRKHRNRLVHFYNPAYSKSASKAVLQEVVTEQCRAWLRMYRWLTRDWKDDFVSYHTRIDRLNSEMAKMPKYLKAKFESLEGSLKKASARGIRIDACKACGFEASCRRSRKGPVNMAECGVCNHTETWLDIECPSCGKDIRVEPDDLETGIECHNCNIIADIDMIADEDAPVRLKDRLVDAWRSCCSECERDESVVRLGDGYVCLVCLTEYDDVENCDCCGTSVAGLREDSYLMGCPLCFGRGAAQD